MDSYLKIFDGVQIETDRTFIRLKDECSVDKLPFDEDEKNILAGEMNSNKAVVLSVFSKDEKHFIGYVEFKNLDTKPELGIELTDGYQHNGYGYEICCEIIRHIFAFSDISCIMYKCFRGNVASQRLAEKLGAQKVEEFDVYQMLREKFLEKGITKEQLDIPAIYDIIVYEILRNDADHDCI